MDEQMSELPEVPDLPDEEKIAHIVELVRHAISDLMSATDCAKKWYDLLPVATVDQREHLRLMIEELRGVKGTLLDDLEQWLPKPPGA